MLLAFSVGEWCGPKLHSGWTQQSRLRQRIKKTTWSSLEEKCGAQLARIDVCNRECFAWSALVDQGFSLRVLRLEDAWYIIAATLEGVERHISNAPQLKHGVAIGFEFIWYIWNLQSPKEREATNTKFSHYFRGMCSASSGNRQRIDAHLCRRDLARCVWAMIAIC